MAVQNQGEIAPLRHAYPVIRPLHRSEIDDEEEIFLLRFIPAHEAENASVSVVGIDPLEACVVIVQAGQAGVFPIEGEKAPYIALKICMEGFVSQIPVQRYLFIPLVELAEILSHKQQLFAGMAQHEGVACLQVGEFVLVDAGHLIDHRAF